MSCGGSSGKHGRSVRRTPSPPSDAVTLRPSRFASWSLEPCQAESRRRRCCGLTPPTCSGPVNSICTQIKLLRSVWCRDIQPGSGPHGSCDRSLSCLSVNMCECVLTAAVFMETKDEGRRITHSFEVVASGCWVTDIIQPPPPPHFHVRQWKNLLLLVTQFPSVILIVSSCNRCDFMPGRRLGAWRQVVCSGRRPRSEWLTLTTTCRTPSTSITRQLQMFVPHRLKPTCLVVV